LRANAQGHQEMRHHANRPHLEEDDHPGNA